MIDRSSLEKQVEISFYKSRGPGGQRKNTRETAVKLLHIPTGLVTRGTESRLQSENRELAFIRLGKKLENLRRKKKPRIATKKSGGVRLREKDERQRHSRKKKERSGPPPEEYL